MNLKKKRTIIGFTTDPYDMIYGYALVFFRFFNYIQKSSNEEIFLFSNNGVCSSLIKNAHFSTVKMRKESGLLSKTLSECWYFYQMSRKFDHNAIFVVNCEIPELILGAVLTLQGKVVFSILQDARVRDNRFFTRLICNLRLFLVRRTKHVLFINKYTMKKVTGKFEAYYLGNPVF